MANKTGRFHIQTIKKGDHPISHIFDRFQWRAARQAVTREIRRQNLIAAIGKIPALQNPCQMVLAAAMKQNKCLAILGKGSSASGDMDLCVE